MSCQLAPDLLQVLIFAAKPYFSQWKRKKQF